MTRPSHDVEIASEPDATRREPASDAVAPPDRSEARSGIARGRDVGDHLVDHPAEAARWTARLVESYRREVDKPSSGDAVVILPGFAGSVLTDIESGKTVRGVQRLWETVLSSRAGLSPAVTEDEEDGRRQRLRPTGLLRGPAWLPRIGALSPYGRLVEEVRSVVAHPDAALEFPYDWRLSVNHSARLLTKAAPAHLSSMPRPVRWSGVIGCARWRGVLIRGPRTSSWPPRGTTRSSPKPAAFPPRPASWRSTPRRSSRAATVLVSPVDHRVGAPAVNERDPDHAA